MCAGGPKHPQQAAILRRVPFPPFCHGYDTENITVNMFEITSRLHLRPCVKESIGRRVFEKNENNAN